MKRASSNNNNNIIIKLYINKYLIIIGVASNPAVATTYRNLIPSPCHATTGVPGNNAVAQQGPKPHHLDTSHPRPLPSFHTYLLSIFLFI